MTRRERGPFPQKRTLVGTVASAVSLFVRYLAAFAIFEWCILYLRALSALSWERLGSLAVAVGVYALVGLAAGIIVGSILFILGTSARLSVLRRSDGIRAVVVSLILVVYWAHAANLLYRGLTHEPLALALDALALVCGVVLLTVLLRAASRGPTRSARVAWALVVVLVLWLPLYVSSNGLTTVEGPPPPDGPAVADAAGVTGAPDGAGTPDRAGPNLLFIVIDTVRADCLSCYGSEESRTPNMDRFSDGAVLFEQCVTPEPLTCPAICSMLTGLYPRTHGVDTNEKTLSEDFVTLAEVLRERGYSTGAFVASAVLSPELGMDQGFDHYREPSDLWWHVGSRFALRQLYRQVQRALERTMSVHYVEQRADEITRRATEWMRSRGSRPYFAFVHYYDAHTPYAPPRGYRLDVDAGLGNIATPYEHAGDRFVPGFEMPDDYLRQEWLRYLGEIAFLDVHVGGLLEAFDALPGSDEAVVVLVADHGESFGHGYYFDHGNRLYDSTVHVPLVVRHRNLPGGLRVSSQVRLIDLFPTVLGLLEIESGVSVQGEDVTPLVDAAAAGETGEHRPGFSQTDFASPWPTVPKVSLSLRMPPWKFISSPRIALTELYDLSADAGELVDVAAEFPVVAAEMAGDLTEWDETTETREVAVERLSDERREALRALGYIE